MSPLKANTRIWDEVVVIELHGEYQKPSPGNRFAMFRKEVLDNWTDRSQPLRILFDFRRVTGDLTRSGGYFNVTRDWGDNKNKRFAWLYSDPSYEEQLRFRETVARNHGVEARVFQDEDEAMRWLKAGGGAVSETGR